MKLPNRKILTFLGVLAVLIGTRTALADPNDANDVNCGLVPPLGWEDTAPFDDFNEVLLLGGQTLPDAFDWRDFGVVPPIRNQGACGSCWAFGTVGPLECQIMMCNGGTEVDLSEQWLVSCNQSGWSCSGGWFANEYHLCASCSGRATDECGDSGAVLEEDFPYCACNADCDCPYDHPYTIEDYSYIGCKYCTPTDDQIKAAILEYGPVAVAVRVTTAFQQYSGGIFKTCTTGSVNHAVVLVGWDDNNGTDGYWIMRNSWGTNWGENGYMRIKYGCNEIGYSANYVVYDYDCNDGNDWTPGDDIIPSTFDWDLTSNLWDFCVLDENSKVQWVCIKYVEATNKLIANHCQTAADTNVPHYHFRYDLTSSQKTDADRYWDWYYDPVSITRLSSATNETGTLDYAMDEYVSGANYDYWIKPAATSDAIFTDDCAFWQGQPPTSCRAGDRIAYEDASNVYQHCSVVNSISRTYNSSNCTWSPWRPSQLQWKPLYGGVYRYNTSYPYYFDTPGRIDASHENEAYEGAGEDPSGTWDADYWDKNYADVYYDD